MPDRDRALATALQIIPQTLLMRPRLPSALRHRDVGDVGHRCSAPQLHLPIGSAGALCTAQYDAWITRTHAAQPHLIFTAISILVRARKHFAYGNSQLAVQLRIVRLIWFAPAAIEQRDAGADARGLALAVLSDAAERLDRDRGVPSRQRLEVEILNRFPFRCCHLAGDGPPPCSSRRRRSVSSAICVVTRPISSSIILTASATSSRSAAVSALLFAVTSSTILLSFTYQPPNAKKRVCRNIRAFRLGRPDLVGARHPAWHQWSGAVRDHAAEQQHDRYWNSALAAEHPDHLPIGAADEARGGRGLHLERGDRQSKLLWRHAAGVLPAHAASPFAMAALRSAIADST